jgi:phospholipase/lecithinase/hemolysin
MSERAFSLHTLKILNIFLLMSGASLEAHPFDSIVSFGDSLSDTTNNPATGDYWEGRWSNGPLWDEYVASDLGATLYDFAYSGSTTADLASQIAAADVAGRVQTNTLYTVWSGGNDLIDDAAENGTSIADWDAASAKLVQNVAAAVSTLFKEGARYVVVFNVPDLSILPAISTDAAFASERGEVSQLVSKVNSDLASGLASKFGDGSVHLTVINDFGVLDEFYSHASVYGFTVVTTDALDALKDPSFTGAGEDYLFWDVIHPTTKAHELMAGIVTNILAELPPLLLSGPSNQVVVAGESVALSAEALDAESYQWLLNGGKIKGATNGSYTIASAAAATAGTYEVKAVNAYGSVTSKGALLKLVNPPKIVTEPRSESGIEGKSVVLSASASGTAPLHYQWQLDGADVAGGVKPTLLLTKLNTNEAGSYVLVVTNSVGSATSYVATLDVIVPPSIVSGPIGTNVVAGSLITFSVVAEGTAPLRYQWEHNGAALKGATNSSFTFPVVTASDAGRIQVLVRNAGGSVVSAAATLKVEKALAGN